MITAEPAGRRGRRAVTGLLPSSRYSRGVVNTTAQFWPPNPKALLIAVRTGLVRAVPGT
jgi:hypothetical protein